VFISAMDGVGIETRASASSHLHGKNVDVEVVLSAATARTSVVRGFSTMQPL
jgi:hypothetical protein